MENHCTAVYSAACSKGSSDSQFDLYRSIFSRNHITLTRVSDYEAWKDPGLLSDPFLLLSSVAGVGWFEKMSTLFRSHRMIADQEPDRSLPGLSTVVSNDTENVLTALSYLRQLGAERIAFFGFHKQHAPSVSTMNAFFRFAYEMGLTIHPEDIFWNTDTLEQAAERLLPVCDPFDAVVAINAGSAAFITQKLLGHGCRIPEDIRVISMADSKMLSMMIPSITAFARSDEEIAFQALHAFQFLRRNPTVRQLQLQVRAELQIRASTGFVEPVQAAPLLSISPTPVSAPESGYERLAPLLTFFEGCDQTDLAILYGLMENMKKAELAAYCYISPSTLAYRSQMILEKTRMKNVEELTAFLKKYYIF